MTSRIPLWFAGTSAFAVPSLKALLADERFSVDLVITQPDRPVGRKQVITPPPVKPVAMDAGIEIFQPENLNSEEAFENLSARKRPEFLVVVSYGQILKQRILDLPTIAPINVHGSLLPRWRGASPIQHTILEGDTESGVTVQKMVKELDAGPILSQEKKTLDARETYTTLHDALAEMGATLLVKTLSAPLKPKEQDTAKVTICHKLNREKGVIDHLGAAEADRFVRALNPWPGAMLKSADLKVLASSLEPTKDSHPHSLSDGSTIHLVTVQPAGGKPMTGKAWSLGTRK
jgi:methionyl-tRNA formyltransferase